MNWIYYTIIYMREMKVIVSYHHLYERNEGYCIVPSFIWEKWRLLYCTIIYMREMKVIVSYYHLCERNEGYCIVPSFIWEKWRLLYRIIIYMREMNVNISYYCHLLWAIVLYIFYQWHIINAKNVGFRNYFLPRSISVKW